MAVKTDEERLLSIQTSRDNILNLIELITRQPKPNYDIDGQKVMWADYLKLLQSTLAALDKQVDGLLPPVEGIEQGYC